MIMYRIYIKHIEIMEIKGYIQHPTFCNNCTAKTLPKHNWNTVEIKENWQAMFNFGYSL